MNNCKVPPTVKKAAATMRDENATKKERQEAARKMAKHRHNNH